MGAAGFGGSFAPLCGAALSPPGNTIKALLPEDAYERMHQRLTHQAQHAKDWRDIINTYFHRISDIDDEKGRTIYE